MNNRQPLTPAILVLALIAPLAIAQDQRAAEPTDEDARATMEAWSAAAEVGEQHLWLSNKTGQWEAELELWMDPDGEPMEGRASVSRQMELGGRVLLGYWNGETMGGRFEGVARTGHDNVTGRYWSTWTDTMSTGLFDSRGTAIEDTDSLELEGEYVDPLTNERVQTRYVWTFPAPDREIMENYETRGGDEMLVMRITLARTAAD